MRIRIAMIGAAVLLLGSPAIVRPQAEPAVPKTLVATIDVQQTATPVSKYEFGMFIEHIGSLIYRSLWSEMLDDRKFYFPISSKDPRPRAGAPGSLGCSFANGGQWAPMNS